MTDKKYCLQLAECTGGSSKDVYSYDEIEIGTWVDGKPIYRKVIASKTDVNPPGKTIPLFNVAELNIERVVRLYGTMNDNQKVAQITPSIGFTFTANNTPSAVSLGYNNQSKEIVYAFVNPSYGNTDIYVVIEYTKA